MAGIQLILGRSGTGKTRWCIDRIAQALAEPGDGPLVLLVPEQATYQAERAILSRPGIQGFSRLRVVSFERLQYLLGAPSGAELSQTARQMILHKILLELSGKLKLYRGDLQRTGLAAKFAGLLTELQADNCTARQIELLAESLSGKPGQELTAAKWTDIAAVFKAYEAFFEQENGFFNPDIQLKKACPQVDKTAFLKGAKLWVDGFSGFSGQEFDLLIEMLKVCDSAQLAFCLDPSKIDPDNDDSDKLDPDSLFASAEETCCKLVRVIRRLKLPLGPPVRLETPRRFEKAAALAAVESNLAAGMETPAGPAQEAIEIAACSNIRAEAFFVAESISELVRRKGLRYRDIAVVLPEMDTYPHYIESAFREYGIPYFLDRPRRMKTHPLIELIGSALQAAMGRFTLADVLSFLKSGLSPMDADSADLLETYARAYDIQSGEWTQETAWDFAPPEDKKRYDEAALNRLRQKAVAPLKRLHQALTASPEITAGRFVAAVWSLLEELNASTTLAKWAAADLTDQQYGHRQVFEKLIELFDRMHRIFGDRPMPASGWASIVTDAFNTLTIKLIPPALDQTLVGSIERSRHPDIQAIFLMGAVQKQFPVPLTAEPLLTETDYEAAAGFEVHSPARLELTHRPYLAYIALTRASSKMVLSYPMLDEKGSAVVPWSGLESLRRCFGDLQIQTPQIPADEPTRLSTSGLLSQWLCLRLGRDRQNDEQTDTAAGLLERLRKASEPAMQQMAVAIDKALVYDNTAELAGQTAARLFGRSLTVSASRLATFAACPYQYFAKYTLRLRKRQTLGFEPLDMGSFYHRVLEEMFRAMQADGKTWAAMEAAELDALCRKVIDGIVTQDAAIINFIRRKAHHRCILQAAIETIRGFVPKLAELSRAGAFRQAAAELAFEPDRTDGGFITLADGRAVHLSGRIDRLDTAGVEGQTLGMVLDYKSGVKAANYAKILYGLDVQLPIYLLSIGLAVGGQTVTPAGAFFLPIDGGFEKGFLSELDPAQLTFSKARGMFDGRFFAALDGGAAPSKYSRYYNFCLDKEGLPYSHYNTTGALRPEDFAAMLAFARRHIGRLAQRMAAGSVEIQPYRLGTQSPCPHCDYRAVCRFDWQINDYNILPPCDKQQAIEQMKDLIQPENI